MLGKNEKGQLKPYGLKAALLEAIGPECLSFSLQPERSEGVVGKFADRRVGEHGRL